MYRIRRFGVVKTATVVALLYMVIVAIFVVPVLLIVAAVGSTVGSGSGMNLGGNFTAIACLLYNLVAGWTGGVEIQLEAVQPPPAPPTWDAAPPTTPAPPTVPPPPTGIS